MYLGDDPHEKHIGGAAVKVRDPWRVGLLAVFTLGIYGLIWFYLVNRELDEFAKAKRYDGVGLHPVIALLLVTVGAALVVPAVFGWIHFFVRIRRAQALDGVGTRLSGWAVAFLWIVACLPFGAILLFEYLQFQLNEIWRASPDETAHALRAPQPATA